MSWTCIINDLYGEKVIGTYYEKEFQKSNQEEFGIEKTIDKRGKWKRHDNSFNSRID